MSFVDTKSRPVAVSCASGLVALALHLLLVAPVLMGFGTSTKAPKIDSSELETSTGNDAASSSITAAFIEQGDLGVHAQADETTDRLAADGPLLKSVPLAALKPKVSYPADDAETESEAPDGSSQPDPGRQLLYGRYVGQITARIERAWMRPRTPIQDGAFFACRVNITQDRRGVVQEIELVRCNGTPRWQTSLVQAIQSASPLPAPPDADVYSAHLTLELQSATFLPGESTDGFAPP